MLSVRLEVYVQPRAARTGIAGMHDGRLKIRIAAPAVDNAANLALIGFLAEHCGVPRRQVRIIGGASGRRKLVEIEGISELPPWQPRGADVVQ
jgi:uncharacterized protein (TIGR00251 family)